MVIKCIIFDIGGVVVGSPIRAINEYERERGLPRHWINIAITARGPEGAFQRFERNELDLYTFYKRFGAELSDVATNNEAYRQFAALRGKPEPKNLPQSLHIDGRELFKFMMRESFIPDPKILKAIVALRQSGRYKVAALTNNFTPPVRAPSLAEGGGKAVTREQEVEELGLGPSYEQLKSIFDLFVESSKVGMRKPDPAIYKYTLKALGIEAHEAVFLDDIGLNLKPAKQMGMTTIRVSLQSSVPAIQELEKIVNLKLLDEEDVQEYEAKMAAIKAAEATSRSKL